MSDELDKRIATPWFCNIEPTPEPVAKDVPSLASIRRSPIAYYAGSADIDRLFVEVRSANHVLQSARLAKINGMTKNSLSVSTS